MTYKVPVQVESWWIVTLRRSGDDEDDLYILKAKDWKAAAKQAEKELREGCDMAKTDEVYVNCVVSCGRSRPVMFKSSLE